MIEPATIFIDLREGAVCAVAENKKAEVVVKLTTDEARTLAEILIKKANEVTDDN